MKVSELASDYLNLYSKVENKPSATKAIEQIIKRSINPLLGEKEIDKLTGLDIARFKHILQEQELSNKTINNHLTVLRAMLIKASDPDEWNLIHTSRVPRIKGLQVGESTRRRLNKSEIVALTQAAKDYRERPWLEMIIVALLTGLRVGELRGLRWEDIDVEKRRLRIVRAAWSWSNDIQTPKSNKPRYVPIDHRAIEALTSILRLGPWVFSVDGSLLTYERAIVAMRRIASAAGVKNCTWHNLRHTFATQALEHRMPVTTLQKILGHAHISTTMIYAKLTDESLYGSTDALAYLVKV